MLAMRLAAIALALAAACVAVSAETDTIVPEEPFSGPGISIGEECSMDVKDCFVPLRHEAFPKFKEPVSFYQDSYESMCEPEKKHKQDVLAAKKTGEKRTKELCKKSEVNQKRMEKEVKLTEKKEGTRRELHDCYRK